MPQLPSTMRARSFYKQGFELRNKGRTVYVHTMLLNPGDMSFDEPPRTNVVQTLGGAYVVDFGKGLPNVTISGTTGYNARTNASGDLVDGYVEWKNLRDKVYRYYVNSKSNSVEMYWFNWEDSEFYKVVPLSFRLMRSKSEPLMYRYELRFVAISKLGAQNRIEKALGGPILSVEDKLLSDQDILGNISALSEITAQFTKGSA